MISQKYSHIPWGSVNCAQYLALGYGIAMDELKDMDQPHFSSGVIAFTNILRVPT